MPAAVPRTIRPGAPDQPHDRCGLRGTPGDRSARADVLSAFQAVKLMFNAIRLIWTGGYGPTRRSLHDSRSVQDRHGEPCGDLPLLFDGDSPDVAAVTERASTVKRVSSSAQTCAGRSSSAVGVRRRPNVVRRRSGASLSRRWRTRSAALFPVLVGWPSDVRCSFFLSESAVRSISAQSPSGAPADRQSVATYHVPALDAVRR
jgi:hypothetical protein